MGLLDKAKDAATKGLEGAKEKGQGLALRRKQTALAADLGNVVFRQREGEAGLDAEIDRLVSEMRGVKAELDAAQG